MHGLSVDNDPEPLFPGGDAVKTTANVRLLEQLGTTKTHSEEIKIGSAENRRGG
jgi:hypothetical protein